MFAMIDAGLHVGLVSTLTLANTHYRLRKSAGEKIARERMRMLHVLLQVHAIEPRYFEEVLATDTHSDFEDGLQYRCAVANKADLIISRDERGFSNAELPVMTAQAFLVKYGPKT